LVAITPASGFTLPMWAIVIGAVAGIVCYFATTSLKHALGYDDSLDAFGVHGIGGTIGAILTGVFAVAMVNTPSGFGTTTRLGLVEGSWVALSHEVIAVAIAYALAALMSVIILLIVDAAVGLRVREQDEYEGLDITQHGESGYNEEDAFGATYSGSEAGSSFGGQAERKDLAASEHG
jgi:Amt family ammonium transporter